MHARWQWHSPGASRPRAESRRFASLESVSIRKMRKKERERERFLRSRNLIASSRDDTWHRINPRSFHDGSGDVRPHTDYPRERTFNLTSLLSFLDRNNRMCSPRLCVYTCLSLCLSLLCVRERPCPGCCQAGRPLYRMMDLLSIRLSRPDKFQGNLVARHG